MVQGKEESDRRTYCMINLHERMNWAGMELATPASTARYTSVVRHVSDCSMWPSEG